jgi:hypothetical protein
MFLNLQNCELKETSFLYEVSSLKGFAITENRPKQMPMVDWWYA